MDLRQWHNKGASFIVFTYSENDWLFYKRNMSTAFTTARNLGLSVWVDPWGIEGIFSGETPSWFLLYHPDTWQVRADGTRVPHACPNAPSSLKFLRTWIDTVAEAGAEWILWDEPHWYVPGVSYWQSKDEPSSLTCYCHHCQGKFHSQFHRSMPSQEDEDMALFRHDSMLALLTQVTEYAAIKGLKNAVCWAPPEQLTTGLSLEDIITLKSTDELAIDPYWLMTGKDLDEHFSPIVRHAVELCKNAGKPLQVWLQGFGVPNGREPEILKAAEISAHLNIKDTAIWYHHGMSTLLPDDPHQLDGVLDELFARFGGKF